MADRETFNDRRNRLSGTTLVAAAAVLLIAALLLLGQGTGHTRHSAGVGVVPETGQLISVDTTIHTLLAAHDTAANRAGRIECTGTGQDGDRVQVVYAHPSGTADHLAADVHQLTHDARWADGVFAVSAAQTGGKRHVRWATTSGAAGCSLSWLDITLQHGASTPFGSLVSELSADGLNAPNRHYLVWVDENAGCGRATLYLDSTPGAANLNNISTGYAVAFRPCWDDAEPHELTHTFGGVQPVSPHGTSSGHCSDGPDVMCGPGKSKARGCSLLRLDCGHDDYYSTHPTGWLADHWNAANSSWLYGGLASPVSAPVPTVAPTFAANPAPASTDHPTDAPAASPTPTPTATQQSGVMLPVRIGA